MISDHRIDEALDTVLRASGSALKYYTMPKLSERVRPNIDAAPWVADEIKILEREIDRLSAMIDSAPIAIMDIRDALGICAPTEDDFQAIYAIRGKRVRLVVVEE